MQMREKMALMKRVKENLAKLKGANPPPMRERMALMKQVKDDMKRLKGSAPDAKPASAPKKAQSPKIILLKDIATPTAPRSYPEEQVQQMGQAIKAAGGALQPIVVRFTGLGEGGASQFELVDGELTYLAAVAAGLSNIDAFILDYDFGRSSGASADADAGLQAQMALLQDAQGSTPPVKKTITQRIPDAKPASAPKKAQSPKIILLKDIATPTAPRSYPEEQVQQMGQAIKAAGGALKPIVVRFTGLGEGGASQFELVDGELTYWAAVSAGLESIYAFILDYDFGWSGGASADADAGLLAQIAMLQDAEEATPPAKETKTQRIVRGEHNEVPLGDFIKLLTEAYAEDDDLPGIIQGAQGYYHTHKNRLEGATA